MINNINKYSNENKKYSVEVYRRARKRQFNKLDETLNAFQTVGIFQRSNYASKLRKIRW